MEYVVLIAKDGQMPPGIHPERPRTAEELKLAGKQGLYEMVDVHHFEDGISAFLAIDRAFDREFRRFQGFYQRTGEGEFPDGFESVSVPTTPPRGQYRSLDWRKLAEQIQR